MTKCTEYGSDHKDCDMEVIALIDQPERKNGYFHVKVTFHELHSKVGVRNGDTDSWMNDLTISCQGNDDAREHSVYGWEVRYEHAYSIDRHRAQRMYRTLEAIERNTARLSQQFGAPATYGQFVSRVMHAVHADKAGQYRPASRGWSYSELGEPEWFFTPGDAADHIDYMVRCWQHAQEGAA